MCYHYSLIGTNKQIEERYKATFEIIDEFSPVYHTSGFVFGKMPVILNNDSDHIKLLNWGLLPSWNKDKGKAFAARANTLNARSETIYEKPSFKDSAKNKRCLIPATGFFEWMDLNKVKYPHLISLKDQEIFSFGGLWQSTSIINENGEKELYETFSIITTDANTLMEKIHNLKKRMPLILPKEVERKWLNDKLTKEEVEGMLLPYPEEKMQAHTISKLITSRTESPNVAQVLEKFDYPELLNV